MFPRIRKKGIHWCSHNAGFRFTVDEEEVLVTKIEIPPSVQPAPRVFQKDGLCCAGVHGPCVILQQEIIALVGSHDNMRGDIGPTKQEGAQAANNLGIKGTPNMDVTEDIE